MCIYFQNQFLQRKRKFIQIKGLKVQKNIMLNRSAFSGKLDSINKLGTNIKPQINANQSANNKINIRRCHSNQSTFRSPSSFDKKEKNSSLIKIIPNNLHFQSFQTNQLYEKSFLIRNQSSEIQKVRIIPPTKKQFKLKQNESLNCQMAAGLAIKISVLFCSEDTNEVFEDKLFVMGNSFKYEVALVAESPRSNFSFPSLLNMGTMIVKQQKKIEITLKNIGSKTGSLSIKDIMSIHHCPNITYQDKLINIFPGKTEKLQFFVKPIQTGQIQLRVTLSNGAICLIKAIVVEDQVQIIDQNGSKFFSKDIGQIFIGEKILCPFYISNGTQNQIECILQTINRKKQNVEIKVDKKRNMFISQTVPQQLSAFVGSSSFSLQKQRITIKPFESEKNTIYVQKIPSQEQIDIFIQNLTKNIESTIYKVENSLQLKKNLSRAKDSNEIDNLLTGRSNTNGFQKNFISKIFENDKLINETLAVKISNQDKIMKIPLKFLSKIPNLQIDINSFQFGKIYSKDSQEKQFVLKNLSNRKVNLSFKDCSTAFKENFKIEGPQILSELSEQTFKIRFRPLIKKKFNQFLVIKVCQYFPIQLKIFGECIGIDGYSLRNQMNFTMTQRNKQLTKHGSWKSLLKDKTARQHTETANEISMSLNMTQGLNKTKNTQSMNAPLINPLRMNKMKKFQRSEDEQISKLVFTSRQQNMGDQKLTKQSLFFKKQEFLTSTIKKKPFNHPSNLRELLRYDALSLQQLKKIEVKQKSLDFGHIFIGSKTSKKLNITNRLETPILIELETLEAEALAQNIPESIRIQGYGTYEVNIILQPRQLGELQLPLNYIINKQHVFEVKVMAVVTFVNLELSAKSFAFHFTEDDSSFEKEHTLQVYNNGNQKTRFIFDPPGDSSFRLSTLNGELEPKSSLGIKITYSPFRGNESGEQRVDIEKLKMKVHQGAQNIIKCTGTVKEPKISIKQTEFILGNSITSVPTTNKITIKNLSKVQTYIKLEFQSLDPKLKKKDIESYFSIQSSVYSLVADEKKDILFTLLCHEVKKIDINIVLSIRGYKIVKIPFSVSMVYPQIVALTPEINFQQVPILSNYSIEMFSLVNNSQVQIKLQMDPSYTKDEYLCQILPIKGKYLNSNFEDEKDKNYLNSLASFKGNKRLSKTKSFLSNKVLTLPPNGQQSVFSLKFVPKCVKEYEFQLPLRVFGCVERVIKPVQLKIKCNAVDPIIYVEPRTIKFGTKIINEAKNSYSQSLSISNVHNYAVKFKIESLLRNFKIFSNNKKESSMASSLNDKFLKQSSMTGRGFSSLQNFTFSQYEGEIEPCGKIEIFLMFRCSVEGQYFQKFNISLQPKVEDVKTLPTSLSSYVLDVNGSAIMPTLKFCCNEAIMPVVPLNIQSRMFIMIENHGYDAITICKWKTLNYFPHIEIKVNFPQGKLLSLAKKSLRIEILFSSLAPISFTTILQFYDEFGNKYDLPLSCSADNSIFTSYPYLQSDNQHTILLSKEENMIKVVATGKNPYYEQNNHLAGYHTMSCSFIQKWLNFELNMCIKSFPYSMIESQGKDFVKMINRISSKNLIRKFEFNQTLLQVDEENESEIIDGESVPERKIQRIIQLVDLYAETIKKLKQEGAFLNHIRPQFLLSYSQFVDYQNYKRKIICYQSIFEVTSTQSWISLFYQLCKIYIQPQITQNILPKLKMQNLLTGLSLTSNLYSSVQIQLLKFMNFNLSAAKGTQKSQNIQNGVIVSFSEQIKIFEVIQKVLETNFGLSLSQQIDTLKNNASMMSPHVFLSAIAKFLHAQLKQYGLSVYLGSTDLFTMGAKQLVLYFINLVQMIYHYNNATEIRFQGTVGDKITKIIEIQNPTGKKISYFVKIINKTAACLQSQHITNQKGKQPQSKSVLIQSNFHINESSFIPERTQLIVQPKKKAELKVVYHCKNAKGEASSMYLIPSKENQDYSIPQPLMFKLTTSILSKIVMKKIIVNTSLYEVLPISLDIELPSQIPDYTEFSLSLSEDTSNNQVSTSFNPPSFIFNQSRMRTLKQGNKDLLEFKLAPLSLGQKNCRISYFSPVYGEYIYQICAKVSNPKILKQFRFKDLKVNTEEEVTLTFSKQNQLLNSLLKIYYPDLYNYHNKTDRNLPIQGTKRSIIGSTKHNLNFIQKASSRDLIYQVEIIDSQFVSVAKECECFDKLGQQNKVVLKTLFLKPFKEYSVLLSVKNQLLKDRRLFRVVFTVTTPPTIVKMLFKTPARNFITQKIPLKLTPCQLTLKTNCDCFTIENLAKEYFTNTELVCHFNPLWIQQKQAIIEIQSKENSEQLIYEISLKAEEPQKFGSFELVSSSLFNQEVSIPIDVQNIFSQQQQDSKPITQKNSKLTNSSMKSIYFDVKRLFKRPHSIENQQFYPFLNQKASKSSTGLYTKSKYNTHKFAKQQAEKYKVPKARSMIDEKGLKCINLTLYPSQVDSEVGSIRLTKPNSEEYHWAKVSIKNRPINKLKSIKIQEKINQTSTQALDIILQEESIDFEASDFEYKFDTQVENFRFTFMQTKDLPQNLRQSSDHSRDHQKRPVLIFSPMKEIEVERAFYFKCNNKEYMLPISLRVEALPTIVVPQITTINIEPKITYLNLINGTEQAGTYKVVILSKNDPNNSCFKFITNDKEIIGSIKDKNPESLVYELKAKEKKQIRLCFIPKYINQKEKYMIKFESQTLPNYTYILNGRSEFKVQQQHAEFQVYEDHIKPFHIVFTNLFQNKQNFTIDLSQSQGQSNNLKVEEYIRFEDPLSRKFKLDEGGTKVILISLPQQFFALQLKRNLNGKEEDQNDDPCSFKFVLNIKIADKTVKKYHLNLLVIKNLFSSHQKNLKIRPDNLQLRNSTTIDNFMRKSDTKDLISKDKNFFIWSCKARQTIYQNIQIPPQLQFFVKDIKCPPEISKYLTFTCVSQEENSSRDLKSYQINFLKLKYSPMKPAKKKRYDLILIGSNSQKYRIQCEIKVDEPPIDDTIIIKTSQIDQVGCISFKLTNTTKSNAKYKAYFVNKLPEFTLGSDHGILEGYGKPGTSIIVKFKSHIYNRKLEDKLILETEDMYWCFKVKGMLSKDGN